MLSMGFENGHALHSGTAVAECEVDNSECCVTHINYPVSKHGPRSLSYTQVINLRFFANENEQYRITVLWFTMARVCMPGPERW